MKNRVRLSLLYLNLIQWFKWKTVRLSLFKSFVKGYAFYLNLIQCSEHSVPKTRSRAMGQHCHQYSLTQADGEPGLIPCYPTSVLITILEQQTMKWRLWTHQGLRPQSKAKKQLPFANTKTMGDKLSFNHETLSKKLKWRPFDSSRASTTFQSKETAATC